MRGNWHGREDESLKVTLLADLRAVYATGFFRDVELCWDNGTLVIAVSERPSIESFSITGNKDTKTGDLTDNKVRMTRYHGVFAPHSRWRSQITPAGRGRRAAATDTRTPASGRGFE